MRVVSAIVLALCSVWLCCQPAFAEKRIALVIGNSSYERVPQLSNPLNDATAMSEMFKRAGFDAVRLKLDLKANEMRRALRDFADEARDADIAIIYFAGHGLEIQGTNYLIPVDAVLERDSDAYDEAVSLERLLNAIEPARQLRVVILDACRDNPFKGIKRTTIARTLDRGLARVEPSGLASVEPAGTNTLIAFAAKAGSIAADGNSKNSPFTAALVKYLPTPGLDLRKAFGFVRDEVLKVTNNRQEPFIYGSLGGNDVALVPALTAPTVDPNAGAKEDYALASEIDAVGAWDSFIRKYPSGFYSDLARAQREKLMAARTAPADQARLATEKKALDDANAAAAERARIAAEAKAAEDARVAAEKARAEEAAKAAMAREAAEKQKALAEAKAAEIKAAEIKAAEEARLAAEKRAAEEARAREVERQRIAAQAKVAQDARIEAENAQAVEAAKAAQAARLKAAQVKPDGRMQLAAILPQDPRLGQEAKAAEQQSGCAAISPQLASLSPDTATALSMSEECGLKPKQRFRECQNCPEMVVVPAGQFLMGSSRDEIDGGLAAANEAPQHKVVLAQPIAVGHFEVTRDQYAAFVDATGYRGSDRCFTLEQNIPKERENRSFLMPGYAQAGNHPAVCVSWTDAQAYVDWLSRTTGKPYRLPSEAEYEYAARAGGTARFGLSDDPAELCRFANGADQSAKTAGLPDEAAYMACTDGYAFTAPVGSLAANAFGLYDLIGNVWEWTADCFADDYRAASAARSQAGCPARTVRGGDWFSPASLLRPAVRAKANPDAHHDDIGFRVVRTLAQ